MFCDNKALVHFLNSNSELPPRLQRRIFRVTTLFYSLFKVNKTISNFISLHFPDSVNRDKVTVIDTYVNVFTEMTTTNAINSIDMKQDTAQDFMLTIRNHNWHRLQKKNGSYSITVDLKRFGKIKSSVTCNSHHQVKLNNNRIVFIIRLPFY